MAFTATFGLRGDLKFFLLILSTNPINPEILTNPCSDNYAIRDPVCVNPR